MDMLASPRRFHTRFITKSALLLLLGVALAAISGCGGMFSQQDARSAAVHAEPFTRVSPTIFAGGSIGRPVALSTKTTTITYKRKCPFDDDKAFAQINFGSQVGSIWLSDFTVTEILPNGARASIFHTTFADKESAEKSEWKLLDLKNIGMTSSFEDNALRINVPKRVEFPWDAQIVTRPLRLAAGNSYELSFTARASVEGWPLSSYLMRRDPLRFYASAGEDMFIATSKLAVQEGVETLMTDLKLPWERDLSENRYEMLDQYMEDVAAAAPTAKLIIRFGVEPPDWWRKEYADQLAKWENGQSSKYVSVASTRWLSDSAAFVAAAIGHLESRWGGRIAGYLPLAQSTGEWYYPIWDNRGFGGLDFSAPFLLGFQKHLEQKYGAIDRLNTAWRSKLSAFSEARIPSEAERKASECGIFINPLTQRRLIDYAEYQQAAMSAALENCCAAVKQAAPGKVVMAFYGYTLELPGCQNGIAETGHLDLRRLIDSPHIDGLVNIVSYSNRGVKGTSSIMTPTESITTHGKIPLIEDDTRSHLSAVNAGYERTTTLAETEAVLLRNETKALIHGMPSWKLDLYGGGWYHDSSIWRTLRGLDRAFDKLPKRPLTEAGDVAVIVDERSFMALRPGIELTRPLVYDLRYEIDRMGTASASWWLLDDLVDGKVPPHKLTIVLNAFLVPPDHADRIRAHFERTGGTVLYLYAPGYLTEEGPSLDNMSRLTGFSFEMLPNSLDTAIVPVDSAQATCVKLTPTPFPANLLPRFSVKSEQGVEALGRYQQSGGIATARKKGSNHVALFHAAPRISAETLASLAESAGAHRYAPPGNVVVTNGALLSITSVGKGAITIKLPQRSDVKDIFNATCHRETVTEFPLEMQEGESRFLTIAPSAQDTENQPKGK